MRDSLRACVRAREYVGKYVIRRGRFVSFRALLRTVCLLSDTAKVCAYPRGP